MVCWTHSSCVQTIWYFSRDLSTGTLLLYINENDTRRKILLLKGEKRKLGCKYNICNLGKKHGGRKRDGKSYKFHGKILSAKDFAFFK